MAQSLGSPKSEADLGEPHEFTPPSIGANNCYIWRGEPASEKKKLIFFSVKILQKKPNNGLYTNFFSKNFSAAQSFCISISIIFIELLDS